MTIERPQADRRHLNREHGATPTAESVAQAAHLQRLADRIEQLTVAHHDLREHTDQVAEAVQQVLDNRAAKTQNLLGPPPCWAVMNTEQATWAWADLAEWIENTFVSWYEITRDQLPDCWALHRSVVSELSWLRHAHRAAHETNAPAHLAADWHTHWKPGVLRRVHEAIPRRGSRSCSPGHHLATDAERVAGRTQTVNQRPPEVSVASGDQLAERTFWHKFWERAVAVDLGMRSADTSRTH